MLSICVMCRSCLMWTCKCGEHFCSGQTGKCHAKVQVGVKMLVVAIHENKYILCSLFRTQGNGHSFC